VNSNISRRAAQRSCSCRREHPFDLSPVHQVVAGHQPEEVPQTLRPTLGVQPDPLRFRRAQAAEEAEVRRAERPELGP
jgi:hypothetical protein